MKVRLTAVKHKKYALFFLMSFMGIHHSMFSSSMVMQFRAPLSLSEMLHEGLLSVQENIVRAQAKFDDHDFNIDTILQDSVHKVESLQSLYALVNSRSGLNEVHSDDRNFLQSLIDRIDQMIQTLENSSSEYNADLIKKNIDMLNELRTTLQD